MTEQEALAEARRRYGEYGFAATTGPWKGVGTRTPDDVFVPKRYAVKAGWGYTWEEAFAGYERKYVKEGVR